MVSQRSKGGRRHIRIAHDVMIFSQQFCFTATADAGEFIVDVGNASFRSVFENDDRILVQMNLFIVDRDD